MLPRTKITISPNGDHKVEGMEKSDQCSKINDMGRMAGKVTDEKEKDHVPVHQTVHNRQ